MKTDKVILSDEKLCELAKINYKQRNKLMKQEERMNLVEKTYKRGLSKSDIAKPHSPHLTRVSMKITRGETDKYVCSSPILPETKDFVSPVSDRPSSPNNQPFKQHRPTAISRSETYNPEMRLKFLGGKRKGGTTKENGTFSATTSPVNLP
ncbi:hypothetical protein EDI_142720 [Entamoeba dispar SAW760]|uniref:Uncharacterized protein n=1 Tax=Entamoeba dispar (strain ATCC PRA-260 / SAW760) TaxID=370354 RepID=B0EE19_ENTDS|nr:uncharacterized protein EDI_142720 [Entamoeba dispar SAW760]EDR27230.1 hypothetical protein EDI_142720 [Entamoeba dispar SAW760]|eukprot:EDR27230.1 hypothetical protein EDI_142720 [Entamoeba dispar SAW760]